MARIVPREFKLPDGTGCTVRSAEATDTTEVLRFHRAAIASTQMLATSPEDFTLTADQESEFIRARIESASELFLAAYVGKEMVGSLGICGENKRKLRHNVTLGITVGERWRGRGVGRALMQCAMDWAAGHTGIERVCLGVMASNAGAIRLYESLGFVREGRRVRQFRQRPGIYEDEVLMACRVKPVARAAPEREGMVDPIASRLELARRAAEEAERIVMGYFGRGSVQAENKCDGSPVTIADREAERAIRSMIAAAFPGDAMLGEEFGEQAGTETGALGPGAGARYRWIIDPIDGTVSFLCGVPLFGTMIGVEVDERPAIGVVRTPALGECVYAARGSGAWHERTGEIARAARVSGVGQLSEGVICTTSIDYFRKSGREHLYAPLCGAARHSRGWSDCYAFVLLATGRVEAVVEPKMHPWDIAAAAAIIVEAGGRVTDFSGRESIYSGECIATNGRVHEEVLGLVERGAGDRSKG